jgi:hypothetical protein
MIQNNFPISLPAFGITYWRESMTEIPIPPDLKFPVQPVDHNRIPLSNKEAADARPTLPQDPEYGKQWREVLGFIFNWAQPFPMVTSLMSQMENFPDRDDLIQSMKHTWRDAKELIDRLRKDHLYDPCDHITEQAGVEIQPDGSIMGPAYLLFPKRGSYGIPRAAYLKGLEDPKAMLKVYNSVLTLKMELQALMSRVERRYNLVMEGNYLGEENVPDPIILPEYRHLYRGSEPLAEPTQTEEARSSSSTDTKEDE